MALSEDLINFDLIEEHKENIQSLPSGRSARQLVSVLSPQPSGKPVTFEETKTLNDAIRQEYEIELQSIADADDPISIYDRYVKWTLNAYPSAQSTPQSQLCPLLERATKAFMSSPDCKNDPRYLKFWLHYIRFFSDTPRETFAFLARHNIGEHLALFYEEFASWLEGAGRWNQADEVYQLGIEREARPAERLARKYAQFRQRYEARPATDNEPSSPALPKVRAALVAKLDPFAPAAHEEPQQQARSTPSMTTTKPKKQKMAIFSDADTQAPPSMASSTNGWDSIGSMKERKKENTIEARPWAGETLKAGKRVGAVTKMEVFKDPD
ncbi:protein kinase [Neophaeococcomyces mojaviensis]|uniref:Protein kinase n=1 Tax=Neophaeococcomyces mojaviensis TaxID=3383035 RepID=A0ACC3AJH3_9EURO|nr:protein kinase [Knufia sp. JES_112]